MLERVEFARANGRYSVDAMNSPLLDESINLQVKTPTLFLLGAQDLRVPVSNGLQVFLYASPLIYGQKEASFIFSAVKIFTSGISFIDFLFLKHTGALFVIALRGIKLWFRSHRFLSDNEGSFFFLSLFCCIWCFYLAFFSLYICFALCLSLYLQYARALKERGIESKTIIFPEDIHGIDKLVTFPF